MTLLKSVKGARQLLCVQHSKQPGYCFVSIVLTRRKVSRNCVEQQAPSQARHHYFFALSSISTST
jgi:hypothetical protein